MFSPVKIDALDCACKILPSLLLLASLSEVKLIMVMKLKFYLIFHLYANVIISIFKITANKKS